MISIFIISLDPKIPCQALVCLSCLSVGLPSTAEDSTEAGGVTTTLTPLRRLSWSNVSLLKKTNAETPDRPIYCMASTRSPCTVLEVKHGLQFLTGQTLTCRCHCWSIWQWHRLSCVPAANCMGWQSYTAWQWLVSQSHTSLCKQEYRQRKERKEKKNNMSKILSEIITVICLWGLGSDLMHIWIW